MATAVRAVPAASAASAARTGQSEKVARKQEMEDFFVFALKQFLREDRISSPDGNKIKAF